jgi:hypothetical protein
MPPSSISNQASLQRFQLHKEELQILSFFETEGKSRLSNNLKSSASFSG